MKTFKFFKMLAVLVVLITCINNTWADNAGLYQGDLTYSYNGTTYTVTTGTTSTDLSTPLNATLKVTKVKFYFWYLNNDYNKYGNVCGGLLGYNLTGGDCSSEYTMGSEASWNDDGWVSDSRHKQITITRDMTIASPTSASGNYTFNYYFKGWGDNDDASNCGDNWYLSNNSANYALNYIVSPPAVKSSSVAISATNTAPGSGTGLSSGSPIILISGFASTLTITAEQNHTDANSALYCKFGTGSYSTTTTYDIASGTTQTNQTLALAVKYRNNSASLDGAETTTTIYYKWAAPAPAITMTSVTPSTSIVAGNDITLVGTRVNSSNTISFQYTTNDGTTWTDITPKTSSLSSNTLTVTWTVPDAHGATQTFKFRAKLAEATPIYSGKSDGVTVYNTKTIKVKNTNNWATFKSYVYDYSAGETTAKRENWPGSTTGITSAGGQWKQVVLTSQYTYFILNDGGSNQLKGETYTYASSVTNGGTYAISSGSGSSLTFSSSTAPTAPTSVTTTAAPTSVTDAQMTLNGSIGGNGNDNITDYGFYWGTTSACGTKAQVGTSNTTGSISKQLTSLIAGTTYYFRTYATNGQGTTYGTVQSYKLPYKVTISTNTGCTSISPTGTQYTNSSITVTATKTTGYTFSSWSTTNGTQTSTSSTSTTNTLTFTPTSNNATIRPTYTENSYAVSVSVSPAAGGSLSPTPSEGKITVKQVTGTAITATKNTNYIFDDWTISGGGITPTSSSTSPQTFKATTTGGSIQANFSSQWTIAGTMTTPTWKWDKTSNLLTGFTTTDGKTYATVTISLAANTTYTFKVKDRSQNKDNGWYGIASGSTATYTYADDNTYKSVTSASGNQDISLTTAAAGDYVFRFNITDKKVAVDFPTSHLITSGVKTVYDPNVSNTSVASETGGTYTAVDNSSNNVKGANKYVAAGASVTFNATPNTGYEFDGWYTNAACSEGKTTTNPLTVSSISGNVTRYAKFVEIMTTVDVETYGRGTISIDGGAAIDGTDGSISKPWVQVGVHTTHRVTIASENTGYYFAGWELKGNSDCVAAEKAVNFNISGTASDEDNRTNVTITGLGDPAKCDGLNFLSANFESLDQIYFRNVFDDGTDPATHWSNVYVFFDVSWNGSAYCAVTSANNSSKNLHVQMEAIGSTGIYRAYIPRYATRNNKTKVAFADYDVSSNSANFNPGSGTHHGSYRSDYSNLHNMFVPNHVKEANDGYYTRYYNKGYWMHYTITEGVNAGYWIEERTGTNTYSGKPAEQFVVLNRAFETNPQIRYRLRIDGTSDKNYAIFSEGGVKYKASGTIKYNTCDNISLTEDNGSDAYFTIKPTAEGEYILTIDQSGDVMKLSVEYPVVAGDYVIENAFNDGSAKTTRSNVIKSSQAGTKTRYSMYLNNAGSGTLKLRKCSDFDGSGNPIWTSGDDTNLQTILNDAKFTKGVYQFDITIADDKVSDVDSLRLYTGNFYIKTDAASGGWVTYKNNILDKNTVNFDREDPDSYDHYFCKYFESKECNIKSVIANDYCNQLSDTVKGDGIARMVAGEPYVPVDGTSIRFSYNSATNETKRAYLGASKTADFLNIEPYSASKIYETDGTSDLYGASASDRKFSDQGDWVYEMDLKVVPGGQAGVSASYTDAQTPTPVKHVQTLIANDNIVLGGSGSNKYDIRVVYDFKTNYMMSSFILSDTIKDALEDVDLLWVRHRDRSPQQLSLKGEGKLENVSVVAAIELRYDSVHMSGSGTDHVDTRAWNEFTRPYLKYFVSFPFDVPVNSIFGLNQAELGREYVIQHYNGAKRAKEGLFGGDGDNYWEYLTKDSIMHANEGYCVIFDNDYVSGLSGHIWDNKTHGSSVYLYFPANSIISNITNDNATTKVDTLWCHINRTWVGSDKNHQNTDSHWHMIGSPLFHDSYIKDTTGSAPYNLSSFYYLGWDNRWYAKAVKDEPRFKAMSSRMVQWYGTITWSIDAGQSIYAPRRVNAPQKNYFAKIELSNNNKVADWTYVQLQDGANDNFVLREDMYKMYNSGIPQIYTFAGAYDVAYNGVPEKSQTIPVGVLIRKNGTYTFSMPTTFSGTVTLIDTFEQTRTDLSITDYTVELEKGIINDRFLLEINIESVVTSLENENGNNVLNDGGVHKFIKDDNMYILRNGVIYDAQGRKVK